LIGTRGSPLALAQTRQVIDLLKHAARGVAFEPVPIRTKGDKMHDLGSTAVEGKTLWTHEIEQSLADRQIDIAVHSMKDLSTDLPAGLTVGAVPKRENPRDVLVSRGKRKFNELPGGAIVGTSSVRRKAQLLAARNDLKITDMHGNVETRLRKLNAGDYDAIVLAAAGLVRLGLERQITEALSTDIILPAVGQGALALEARKDDNEILRLLAEVNHQDSYSAVEAERAFARKLGADCHTPVAAYARVDGGKTTIEGLVATPTGKMLVRGRLVSDEANVVRIGEELAERLLSKGADAILEVA